MKGHCDRHLGGFLEGDLLPGLAPRTWGMVSVGYATASFPLGSVGGALRVGQPLLSPIPNLARDALFLTIYLLLIRSSFLGFPCGHQFSLVPGIFGVDASTLPSRASFLIGTLGLGLTFSFFRFLFFLHLRWRRY